MAEIFPNKQEWNLKVNQAFKPSTILPKNCFENVHYPITIEQYFTFGAWEADWEMWDEEGEIWGGEMRVGEHEEGRRWGGEEMRSRVEEVTRWGGNTEEGREGRGKIAIPIYVW